MLNNLLSPGCGECGECLDYPCIPEREGCCKCITTDYQYPKTDIQGILVALSGTPNSYRWSDGVWHTGHDWTSSDWLCDCPIDANFVNLALTQAVWTAFQVMETFQGKVTVVMGERLSIETRCPYPGVFSTAAHDKQVTVSFLATRYAVPAGKTFGCAYDTPLESNNTGNYLPNDCDSSLKNSSGFVNASTMSGVTYYYWTDTVTKKVTYQYPGYSTNPYQCPFDYERDMLDCAAPLDVRRSPTYTNQTWLTENISVSSVTLST